MAQIQHIIYRLQSQRIPSIQACLLIWISLSSLCLSYPTSDDYFDSSASEYGLGAPIITPTADEITLEVNSNYTLRCESKEPTKWILPEFFENPIQYREEPYPTQDPVRPYGNQLVLYNVNAYNVGYYYCINEGASDNIYLLDDEITQFKATKIYIFVNDLETLLVPLEHPIVQAFQFSDVIVPCKPTSKDVEVELKSTTNEDSSFDYYEYNPKYGFILYNVTHFETLFCKSVHRIDRNQTYEQIHFLDVRPTTTTTTTTHNQSLLNSSNSDDLLFTSTTTTTSIANEKGTTVENKITATNAINRNNNKNNNNYSRRYARNNNNDMNNYNYYKYSSTTTTTASPVYGRRVNNNKGGYHSRVKSVTGSINRPVIVSDNRGHAIEGSTFNLTCTIDVIPNILFNMSWETPNNNISLREGRAIIHPIVKIDSSDTLMVIGKSVITIYNADKKKDSGAYKCHVEDGSHNKNSNTVRILVLGQKEHYITLHEASNNTYIRKVAGKLVQMVVFYNGYPTPSIRWYNKDNTPIPATSPFNKYTVTQTERDTVLQIRNVTLKDSGIYTVIAENEFLDKEELKFNLSVKDKPTVSVNGVYIQAGEEASVICRSDAYPPPTISWSFTPCNIQPTWPTCLGTRDSQTLNAYYEKEETENHQVSELRFKPSHPGMVKCSAKNDLGVDFKEAEILIGDLVQPVVVYGVEEGRQIAVGDEVILTCGALAYNYSADIFWYRDNNLIEPTKDIEITNSFSNYSYKKILKFKNIQHENSGSYECRVRPIIDDGSGAYESRILQIKVQIPRAPYMDKTNLVDGEINTNLGDKLMLQCKPSGIPKPIVTWYKDDVIVGAVTIHSEDGNNHVLEEDGTVLKIQFVKPEDEGTYTCQVSNRLGTIQKSTKVKISNMPGLKLGWILGILALIVILIIFIIYLCIRIVRERELMRQMKAAGLANFEEGAVECINPALSLDEQADLLPYDRRFEFPKEKLRLGKQLGSGAFGVVLKGVAEDILPDEKETTVAVKMVKKTANNEVMRALVSELKIMVHLGQHLNVVNLLGAVTKNIAKREVMVIVEYCRYGNVQNFLLKNRKRFINQINPDTDQIDPTITKRETRLSSDYEYNSQGLKYAKLTFSHLQLNNSKEECGDRKSTGLKVGPNSTGYIRQSELYVGGDMDSCNTEQTLISNAQEGDESVILSNNSVQPAWRSNYKPDGSTAMDITTTHLISWAFQVARGMDYLASRKVLHGDLAARNILLCDNNVVKICDFGLARSMYRSDNYKKQGEALLPIKWLALESLGDQVFSTYSDVWSFGIVLWEFFSLAKVPYPGMEADQSLYLKLKDGYRMEKPEYANQELYDIMLECWSANPESRPMFNDLEKRFARLLEDEVTNHYIDLNEPYLRMNSEYFKTGQTDYLALMGCPEEQAPSVPRYVNGNLGSQTIETENQSVHQQPPTNSAAYLQMSPRPGNVIFSPRPQDDYVKSDHFKFPEPISPTISNNLDSPVSKQRTKKTNLPEEIPMLNNPHYDSEAEQSPDPKTQQHRTNNFPNVRETILSTDDNNYVNVMNKNSNSNGNLNTSDTLMSSINNDLKKHIGKDAFSNPSYHILTTVGDKSK